MKQTKPKLSERYKLSRRRTLLNEVCVKKPSLKLQLDQFLASFAQTNYIGVWTRDAGLYVFYYEGEKEKQNASRGNHL